MHFREQRENFASRHVDIVNRHPSFSEFVTAPRNLRLGALVLALIAVNQIGDPLADATLGQEVTYWLVRHGVLAIGLWLADALVRRYLSNQLKRPEWLKPVFLVTMLAVLPLALAETLIEPHLPMRPEFVDDDLWAYSPLLALASEYATLVTIIFPIHLLLWLIIERKPKPAADAANEPAQRPEGIVLPEFLQRTACGEIQEVLALQAEDHFVRVFTQAGSELVHFRFGDAIAQMPDELGLQVHRSWWVAERAVRSAKRGARRWQVTIGTDTLVPISDSYVAAARAKGLLKRKAPIT